MSSGSTESPGKALNFELIALNYWSAPEAVPTWEKIHEFSLQLGRWFPGFVNLDSKELFDSGARFCAATKILGCYEAQS